MLCRNLFCYFLPQFFFLSLSLVFPKGGQQHLGFHPFLEQELASPSSVVDVNEGNSTRRIKRLRYPPCPIRRNRGNNKHGDGMAWSIKRVFSFFLLPRS